MFEIFIKRLTKSSFFWQSLANYFERGWGLIYSIILARLISPEDFGVFVLGTSISVIASLVTRWEIGNLVRVEKYYQTTGFGLAWDMTKMLAWVELIIMALVSTFAYIVNAPVMLCIIILATGVPAALDKFSNLLRCDLEGKGVFKPNFRLKLIFSPISAAITIPLSYFGMGVYALLAGVWVGTIINWWVYRAANLRTIEHKKSSFKDLKKIVKPSFWQWSCFSANTLLNRGDKLMLGTISTSSIIGYYNRSFNFAPFSFMVFGALAGGPAIIAFSSTETEEERFTIYLKRLSVLVGFGLVMGVIWIVCAEDLIWILFGEEWLPAAPYFKAFSMFGAIQGFYFLTCSYMQSKKKYKEQAYLTWLCILLFSIVGLLFVTDGVELAICVQAAMVASGILMLLKIWHNISRETKDIVSL